MGRKELARQLKEQMPEGLTELEQVKKIYIELGKTKSFDIKYYYGDKQTRKKIYRLSQQARDNSDRIAEQRDIVCLSLAYLYKDILREFGVKAEVYQEEVDEEYNHAYNVIYLKDGRIIVADLQRDLHNIQTKSRTKRFGEIPSSAVGLNLTEISEEENTELDKKIGYIDSEKDYKEEYIKQVEQEVEGMGAENMLEYILNSPKIYEIQKGIGFVEMKAYYKSVLSQIAGKYLGKTIYLINCFKKRDDGERDYTLCMYSHEKDRIRSYLFSAKASRFIEVQLQDLARLEEKGLQIGKTPNDPGVKLLKRNVRKAIQEENKDER